MMDLECAEWLLNGKPVEQNEILFISDIESFSQKIKKNLLEKIKDKGFKAVVFIGDILSGLSTDNSSYKIFQQSYIAFEMFYDYKKILKKYSKRKDVDKYDLARFYVGQEVSERLSKDFKEQIKSFKSFVKECYKNKIPVVLFTGNHDSLLSWSNLSDERFIPILEEIHSLKGLVIPIDLQPIRLKEDLYLMGIHTNENIVGKYEFYRIKDLLKNSTEKIERPEQIIFVSHIPGVKKFSQLGSQDISDLKKRFKFKYHYHGHCNDYHGEYDEDGVPTKSVHIIGD
jgi:Icc-related predicted phosphoesterase